MMFDKFDTVTRFDVTVMDNGYVLNVSGSKTVDDYPEFQDASLVFVNEMDLQTALLEIVSLTHV